MNCLPTSRSFNRLWLPLQDQWGTPALQALARLWQLEADAKRQPVPLIHRSAQQAAWNQCLDKAISLLGMDASDASLAGPQPGAEPLLARQYVVRMRQQPAAPRFGGPQK